VQPFASATLVPAAERVAQSLPIAPAHDAHFVAPIDLLAAPQAAAPPPSLTMTELRGDQLNVQRGIAVAPPAEAAEAVAAAGHPPPASGGVPAQSSRAVFGSFSGGASLSGSHAVSVDAFGARLDAGH